jgi:hypothetical protein
MDQVTAPIIVCDGCAPPCATAPQPSQFPNGATKRNHRATARNHGATEAQPSIEDKSATPQPAAYRQPLRLRAPVEEGAKSALLVRTLPSGYGGKSHSRVARGVLGKPGVCLGSRPRPGHG